MKADDRDDAYLWDMREAAREIADLVTPLTREEFSNERITRFAVERLLIILGEAAARVSEPYRLAHPEIPWSAVQRARNLLAHTYGKAAAERVWKTARDFVAPLSLHLTAIVAKPPANEPERGL